MSNKFCVYLCMSYFKHKILFYCMLYCTTENIGHWAFLVFLNLHYLKKMVQLSSHSTAYSFESTAQSCQPSRQKKKNVLLNCSDNFLSISVPKCTFLALAVPDLSFSLNSYLELLSCHSGGDAWGQSKWETTLQWKCQFMMAIIWPKVLKVCSPTSLFSWQ